ncbi:hypothetical protein Taro_049490 [Colocasia esculenta]|uniref:Uncharacterized protein n=1 Tax=Colocasia esculenta TaxID=4460 RepID=A0A843XAZ4_COLES|nr:hypothetical protein [Colocasia esculenta]
MGQGVATTDPIATRNRVATVTLSRLGSASRWPYHDCQPRRDKVAPDQADSSSDVATRRAVDTGSGQVDTGSGLARENLPYGLKKSRLSRKPEFRPLGGKRLLLRVYCMEFENSTWVAADETGEEERLGVDDLLVPSHQELLHTTLASSKSIPRVWVKTIMSNSFLHVPTGYLDLRKMLTECSGGPAGVRVSCEACLVGRVHVATARRSSSAWLPRVVRRAVGLGKATVTEVVIRSRRRCMSRSQQLCVLKGVLAGQSWGSFARPGREFVVGFRAIRHSGVVFSVFSPQGHLAERGKRQEFVFFVKWYLMVADTCTLYSVPVFSGVVEKLCSVKVVWCDLPLVVFSPFSGVRASCEAWWAGRWAHSALRSCARERNNRLRRILNETALLLLGGLRLHGCRVSHAGQSALGRRRSPRSRRRCMSRSQPLSVFKGVLAGQSWGSSARPGGEFAMGFRVILHSSVVFGVFSPQGRRAERGKCREFVLFTKVGRSPLVLMFGSCA